MNPKKEKYKAGEKALTSSQVDEFLFVITDVRDLAMFQIALSGGLRRLDLVSIQKKDIDFELKTLTFMEHKKDRIKTIPLPDTVLNTIRMVLKAYAREKDGRLFNISDKTAYNRFQMYLKRAGIPGRPIHALRSTCIKLCQKNGWKEEQTASLVGDKVSTIQEHYLTPSKEEMSELVRSNSVI